MTERVKTAVALTKGHERIEELPSDWLAAYSCHTWVHGVMYACGVEDPRSHLNDASTDSNGNNGSGGGGTGNSLVDGAAQFGVEDGTSGSDNGDDSSSSEEEDEGGRGTTTAAASGKTGGKKGGTKGGKKGGKKGGQASSSSSDSGSESSSDDEEQATTPPTKKTSTPTPAPPKTPKPPGKPPASPGHRIKTTPKGVVLPPADFVPEMKHSSDEEGGSSSTGSSEFSSGEEDWTVSHAANKRDTRRGELQVNIYYNSSTGNLLVEKTKTERKKQRERNWIKFEKQINIIKHLKKTKTENKKVI